MITLPTGNDAPRTGKKSADIPSLFESKARQDWDSHLNPKYNFDNYFEGTSNRLVRSSSEAIAQEPGKTDVCIRGVRCGKDPLMPCDR